MTQLAALVFVLAAVPTAAAEGGLAYTPPVAPAAPDVAGLVLRLFGLTAVMFALCGGVMWLVRRSKQLRGVKANGTGRLQLQGSLALDRRCAVHLIQADGQTVAVTTDATGLRSLVVLSEPFEPALAEAGVSDLTPSSRPE